MAWPPSSLSFYRALLLAYPAEFREEFAGEMERLAAERMTGEPRLPLWLSLLADVAVNAPREHLHILVRDLRHSLRLFATARGFTATALAALALGLGATVTIFSVINAVLIRSLPFGHPDRLVYLWSPLPRYERLPRELGPSFADVGAFREMSRSFTDITALKQRQLTVDPGAGPMQLGAALVLGNFFQTLETAPLAGRALTPADDRPGADPVVVISYDLWRSQWNLESGVLDRSIRIGAKPYRIVGVMPPSFGYPHDHDFPYAAPTLRRTDLWLPAAFTPRQQADRLHSCDAAIGRLRPGTTLAQARSEMTAIAAQLDPLNLPEMRGTGSYLAAFIDTAVGPVRPLMRLLAGAVLLVLLIGCGNVANLLMARAVGRAHEMGVRTALGAPRARLVRQLLTESLLLSTVGGVLGAILSAAAIRILTRLNPGDIPRFDEVSIDSRVLVFALLISLATGVLFGILPALAASRVEVSDLLRRGGRGSAGGRWRARFAFIIGDVALAAVLLSGAGLLIRSYLQVEGEEKGFAPSTLTMRVSPARQPRTAAQTAVFGRTVVDRLAALPGVAAVGGTNAIPLGHSESVSTFEVEGYPNRPNQLANARAASGEFFRAMGIRLIAGRYLTPADVPPPGSGPPRAIVVSESFTNVYFPRGNALGGHVHRGDPGTPWATIVGIVADVRHSSLEAPPQPTIYEPSWEVNSLAIRVAVPPETLIRSIGAALRELDPEITLSDVRTMRQRTSEAAARRAFQTVLLAAFSAVAVFLALVGLYGLLSHSVRQRAAEIGVRIALGAGRRAVVMMVVREGLVLTASGLAIGLLVAAAVARAGASLLYGVPALDPVTFVAVPALMLAAATVACFLPAWKAARIDPVASLREQ